MERGIYAVGWPQLTEKRRWMAAVLACGEGAALSHCSAAALLGIGTERSGLVDVACAAGANYERAVNNADKRDLIDPETLRFALDRYAGEPGVRPLRKLLDRLTFRLSDSDLEIFFRPIAAAAKLPPPVSNFL